VLHIKNKKVLFFALVSLFGLTLLLALLYVAYMRNFSKTEISTPPEFKEEIRDRYAQFAGIEEFPWII
jgi:hypothetical protein